jgi:hypothetical protein
MAEHIPQKLAGKEFRTLRQVKEAKFTFTRRQQKLLREAPLSDLFDPRFLARVGLGRDAALLSRLAQGVHFTLQSLGLRTVGEIEERLSLDILSRVPGMGAASLAFLADLLCALGVRFADTRFGESMLTKPQGGRLADALGLPA